VVGHHFPLELKQVFQVHKRIRPRATKKEQPVSGAATIQKEPQIGRLPTCHHPSHDEKRALQVPQRNNLRSTNTTGRSTQRNLLRRTSSAMQYGQRGTLKPCLDME
jgi:hypothetical protein